MKRFFAAGVACALASVLAGVLATAATANAPETSLRPVARPAPVVAVTPQVAAAPAPKPVRPRAAPNRETVAQPAQVAAATQTDDRLANLQREAGRAVDRQTQGGNAFAPRQAAAEPRIGLLRSLRPLLRPRDVTTRAVARQQDLARGAICGDPDIQGSVVGPVSDRSGCGIDQAVKVRAIHGIALSQQAVMDCVTAKSLKKWISAGLKPAVGSTGGGVARLQVAAHYVCRTRNSQKGAKISEHGKGRAVDIAAIQLQDGSEISVLRDWDRGRNGKILRNLHASACGPFGTVLGPNSDHFHRDHLHFDTARYRSGSYCR